MDEKLILLDLDGTVIKSVKIAEDFSEQYFDFIITSANKKNIYYTSIRPGVKEFVQKCLNEGWQIGIWSAATRYYVESIKRNVFSKLRMKIKYAREDCHPTAKIKTIARHRSCYVSYKKPVKQFCQQHNMKKRNVVLIDDKKKICRDNGPNAINIKPWKNEIQQSDDQFEKIFKKLCKKWK